MSEAVKLDEASKFKEAVHMYLKALDHFVPALQCKLVKKYQFFLVYQQLFTQ